VLADHELRHLAEVHVEDRNRIDRHQYVAGMDLRSIRAHAVGIEHHLRQA